MRCYFSTQLPHTSHTRAVMSNQLQYWKTRRHTSQHRRPDALHAADMVQLQHFNRSIPFYMLPSDIRAFVNKVASSGSHGLPAGWQRILPLHDVHRNGCQGSTIIIYSSSGRRNVSRHTRQPNLIGLMVLSTSSSALLHFSVITCGGTVGFKICVFSWV